MQEYPLRISKVAKISMKYFYNRVEMNEELRDSKNIKSLTSHKQP